MNNTSASETDIYSQDSIKNFQSTKCPEHHCSLTTLYRELTGSNGVKYYAQPTNVCPQCFDLSKLGHWVERPAGYIPYEGGAKGNGQTGHAQMFGERKKHLTVNEQVV